MVSPLPFRLNGATNRYSKCCGSLPIWALATRAPKPARSESASLIGTQVRALRIASGASGGELARRSGQPDRSDFCHVRTGKGILIDRILKLWFRREGHALST